MKLLNPVAYQSAHAGALVSARFDGVCGLVGFGGRMITIQLPISEQDSIRFNSKTEKTENCWNWIGTTISHGTYGTFWVQFENVRAHRLSWMMAYGQIPDGFFICHHCDNPRCVRPDHLFIGTVHDNNQDMCQKKRHALGERNSQSKLTDNLVRQMRLKFSMNCYSYSEIAESFGVSRTTALRAILRQTWRHVS